MISAKCSVRISLIDGSSDLDSYIEMYGKEKVANT